MEKKITDRIITSHFNLPTSTIQDWKKSDKNDWRFKLYNFVKRYIDLDQSRSSKISSRTLIQATRIFALSQLFKDVPKNNIEKMREVFEDAECFSYHNFNEETFEANKIKLIYEASKLNELPTTRNEIINFISTLDINSYIIAFDFYNNGGKK